MIQRLSQNIIAPDVLVTGACGHLGYALMRSLPEYDYSPIGVDILPTSDEQHNTITGSISDPESCKGIFQTYPSLRYVLHTATLHKPHVGSHSKTDFIDTNIRGTLNLLEAASSKSPQIEAFIFTSTTSTFGKALAPKKGEPAAWIDEQVTPVPKNIYGTTKVAAEDLCQLIQAETSMPTIVLRTSRFFPEEDDSDAAREEFEDDNLKVCELLYRRVDIQDVVTAHVCAMHEARKIGWAKYIISAPPPFTNSPSLLKQLDTDAAEAIQQARPEEVEILLERGWKLPRRLDRVYDPTKAVNELGWKPMYTFERALARIKDGREWRSPLTLQTGKRAKDVGFEYDPTDLVVWEHDYGHYPFRSFESTDLTPPAVARKVDSPACHDGLLTFLTPRGTAVNESRGFVILDDEGELVWMQKTEGQPYNLDVQTYQGAPHLTYWLGDDTVGGHGEGDYYLLSSSYDLVAKISALDDLRADLHTLSITANDTAIISIYQPYEKEKGGQLQYLWDCVFQEIDIATNSLVFQWRASDYHDTSESYHEPRYKDEGSTNHTHWDWYHLNSVEKDDLGNYLVSARYTHSISYIDGQTGDLIWTLGGKRNMFTSSDHAFDFASQHFAQFHSVDDFPNLKASFGESQEGVTTRLISLFDNRNDDTWDSGLASRGLLLAVSYPTHPDFNGKINKDDYLVRIVHEYLHPNELIADSQGSLQVVPSSGDNQDPSIVVGWGARAVWSSYSSSGKLMCDDHFGTEAAILNGSVQSYHVMRYPWIGLPSKPLAGIYNPDRNSLFVSWNGATEVDSYALQHNDESASGSYAGWIYIGITPKDGFETEVVIGKCVTRFVRVVALDVEDNVLGVSEAIELPFKSGFHCDEINNMYITSDGNTFSAGGVTIAPVALIMAAMSFTMFLILMFESWRAYKIWQKRREHAYYRLEPSERVLPPLPHHKQPAFGKYLDHTEPPDDPFDEFGVNDLEACDIITALVVDARQDLDFLRQVLANHADLIVTRWKKKSREKRTKFLSENVDLFDKKWAAIHLLHRCSNLTSPEYSEFTRRLQNIDHPMMKVSLLQALHDSRTKQMISNHLDTWLLPYLNAEMLSEDPSLLLSLLHHRTSYEPEKWVLFDNLHVDLAERFGVIVQTFNAHCVVMQGSDFGKLVEWTAHEAHRFEIIGFTRAHNILSCQQRMMAFLRKCVAGLLDEMMDPPVLQSHPKWNQLVNADFSRFGSTSAWSTDSVRAFSSPPTFDPVETIELIRSHHRLIKDHVEQLQTDPAYVQQHARELGSALLFETFERSKKWPHLVDSMFSNALLRECWWRQLVVESDRIVDKWRAFVQDPSEFTRHAYDQAVICVQMFCVEMFTRFEQTAESALLYERGFERNFEFSGNGQQNHHDRRFKTRDCFPEDILYWSVSSLGHDKYRPFAMDPTLNFAVVDYLCRTNSKEADRISQDLLHQLSDMAILNSIISNVRCYPHLDRFRPQTDMDNDMHLREDYKNKINTLLEHEIVLGDATAGYLDEFCTKHPWPRGRQLKFVAKITDVA
ncbi:hypothetical protein E4T43_01964 [Aureobasidium subglaciale]|nr:hypothetical protein E4T43_01964 [Aureobasidium subglaciale]